MPKTDHIKLVPWLLKPGRQYKLIGHFQAHLQINETLSQTQVTGWNDVDLGHAVKKRLLLTTPNIRPDQPRQ